MSNKKRIENLENEVKVLHSIVREIVQKMEDEKKEREKTAYFG